MVVYDKLFLAGYFLAIIIIQCRWQSALFKANKPISHKMHAVIYLLTIGPAIWFFWPLWWQVIVMGLLERVALFDVVLNLCRSKPLFYNGKGTTGSGMDWLENHLSAWAVKVLKVLYAIIFIVALILIK